MPDSVHLYIQSAIDTMEKYSVRKKNVNWTILRKSVSDQAKGATSYSETYPAIRFALKLLGDNHSLLKTPQEAIAWSSPIKVADRSRKVWKQPIGIMRDGNIAELNVNSHSSGNIEENLKYAQAIQDAIRKLDAQNPIGWVIDLTYNRGGNMWPMLAGIGPLLNEGKLGAFYTADGVTIPWFYKNGEVGAGRDSFLKLPNPYKLKNKTLPIAVFVSHRTASSGEAIAVSLKGRAKVKLFGEPSAGLSTANDNYNLKDGAQLILTSAVFKDNTGQLYGGRILPDVNLHNKWYYITGFEHLLMLNLASKWIRSSNN